MTSTSASNKTTVAEDMTAGVLLVNGEKYAVAFPTHHTLLEVLREECGLTGTKHGCELGECGACAVVINDVPVFSCMVLAADAIGKSVRTVEGLQQGNQLHPLQECFADLGAAQCGYCTPGMLVLADALLKKNPDPTDTEIAEALSGNLCRCTGYNRIIKAVQGAAAKLRGEDWKPDEELIAGAKPPA